jgi:branched-chain amino acid transport system permease protein
MDIFVSSLAAGLLIDMVFALVALGLTIIFGVMDIANFAHGEFLMIGMYTALLTSQTTGLDPLCGAIIMVVSAVEPRGIWGVVERVRRRQPV